MFNLEKNKMSTLGSKTFNVEHLIKKNITNVNNPVKLTN